MAMKSKLSELSEHYQASLRIYLGSGIVEVAPSVQDLGNEAVALGLETLDLAKIHEFALSSLVMSESSRLSQEVMTNRAKVFFTEVIVPIERTHKAALETDIQLQDVGSRLNRRTQDLAESKTELQEQKSGREKAEVHLKKSVEASQQLLKDSRELEEDLQDIAHKIISANEDERKKMSLHLHDDIAQALLGIHIRLHALKQMAKNNNVSLMKEIVTIQRMVEKSVIITNRLTLEFGNYDER
jgi:signal transduction histidine kinase